MESQSIGTERLERAWLEAERRLEAAGVPATYEGDEDIGRRGAPPERFEPAFEGLGFTHKDAEAFAAERYDRMMQRMRQCKSPEATLNELRGSFMGAVSQALCIGSLTEQQGTGVLS